jgi:hypothetical protein
MAKTKKKIKCDCCKQTFPSGTKIIKTEAGNSEAGNYCTDCFNTYPACSLCGRITENCHFSYDSPYCDNCYDEVCTLQRANGFTHDEKYIPETFKYLNAKNQDIHYREDEFYFGFELETAAVTGWEDSEHSMEMLADMVELLCEKYDWLYCKNEPGIQSVNVEFVSHPFTIEWLQEHQDDIRDMLTTIAAYDFVSESKRNCGLHVHISLAPFRSECDEAYSIMAELLYHDWKTFAKFSRRKSFQCCGRPQIEAFLMLKDYDRKIREISSIAILHRDCAITHGINNTAEIRIFGGTLDFIEFFAALQLTSNLAEWTKQQVRINRNLREKPADMPDYDFTSVLNYKQYAELNDFYIDTILHPNDTRLIAV